MKKFLKVLGVIIAIIVIALAAVTIWQWDNINAVINYANSTPEQLQENLANSKVEMEKVLEEYNLPVVRDFTEEEEKKLMKGEITPEEAVEMLLGKTEETTDAQTEDTSSTEEKTVQEESKGDIDEIIGRYVTQIYGIKAKFLGQLGSIEQRVKSEYLSLDKSQRTTANKAKIASKYIGEGLSLESTCDGEVDAILKNMEAELKKAGGDLSIIDTIRNSYYKEKSAKKSYYMGMIK